MAGAAKKWFIGCGIGCGFFLLLAVGAGTIGYFGVRQAMDRGEEIEAGFETLRAEYGDTSDFVPDPSITVSSSRMAAFLAARETMAPMRKEAGDVLRTLDDQEVDGKKPGWMQKARAGINLIPSMMGFIEDRNQAMLDAGIGFGEYLYIYTLVYYNYLDMQVADGPSFTITSDDHDEDEGAIRWSTNDSDDYSDEKREKRIRRYLHGVQLKMARNQLEEMDRRGGYEAERALLVEEIGLMEAESLRLLWETGLPESLRASFDLYRQELADSYDPMTNVFESGLVEND